MANWIFELNNPQFVVAPMVDASELAWRLLCRRHGANLCYTPMLHSNVFTKDAKYRKDNLVTCEEDRPLIVQFCGNNPEIMASAAKLAEEYCDAIDINLGCPQSIAKRGRYGSFLQDDWELLKEIVTAMSKAVSIPITCKVRIFEDIDKSVNYAKMLEASGCKLLTVHGRTREQKGPLTGIASWKHIKAISFTFDENNDDRQLLATAQNINDFKKVCENLKNKYQPYQEGKIHYEDEENISRTGYNLILPPWICQPYVRMSPEAHTQKMHELSKNQNNQECKRINEDQDGNHISRKKMKKMKRMMRRPQKADQNQNGRNGDICFNDKCPNPLGGKCTYKLCKKCCKNKCYEEDLDCRGHRILVHTRREIAKLFANKNTEET
ncbi:tRNA-dihydrouridine(20a/20b) synthase [NAD(P)+]-like isoform X2 [Bombyx mori]|uniref:tRNA-dihydrouridine(16/17) synthase [NAD(P)(+)] n=1 Tax=Bombyx mori TaxID=7091 RepID=A0A8R2LYT3_BOMMO|nr:tRNA-dihydrouridine(20a/20b) synthase [NAD(P)+]-like isoform X3 [Bombyx mori]